MSKHKRKHANRQKPKPATDGAISPRQALVSPIVLAHEQLDDWIAGRLQQHVPPSAPYSGDNDRDTGVIWLGELQHTMVKARKFYKSHKDILQVEKMHYQSDHAGKRPEPHRTPADDAAVTMANARSEQVPAIPLPLFRLKKQCSCGKSFWKLRNYEAHYAHKHIVLGEQPL